MTYRIKDWDKNYENNRTRGMVNMQWVPFSNSHDGDGFTQLISEKNGTALFGAWVLIVQVASKCNPRGTLLRSNGEPHDFDSLARMTRGDKRVFKDAVKVLVNIGWIEEIESKTPMQEGAGIPHPTDEEEKEGIEGNGMEGMEHLNESEDQMPKEIAPVFYEVAEHLKKRVLETRQNKITEKTIKDWANCARLMNTYDGRTIEQMHQLIDECHNMEPRGGNGFTWRNNILSMSKMRLRWNEGKIAIGMNKNIGGNNGYQTAAEKQLSAYKRAWNAPAPAGVEVGDIPPGNAQD